jgi:hypothetical protein
LLWTGDVAVPALVLFLPGETRPGRARMSWVEVRSTMITVRARPMLHSTSQSGEQPLLVTRLEQ